MPHSFIVNDKGFNNMPKCAWTGRFLAKNTFGGHTLFGVLLSRLLFRFNDEQCIVNNFANFLWLEVLIRRSSTMHSHFCAFQHVPSWWTAKYSMCSEKHIWYNFLFLDNKVLYSIIYRISRRYTGKDKCR